MAQSDKHIQEKMSREEVLIKLKEATDMDTETGHVVADEILCKFLASLGYQDIVDAYEKIDKWYA